MRNLTEPNWIWLKGILFAILGIVACTLLLLHSPELKTGILLTIAIWAFCRAYYFAFYVIEKYVDPRYRFAGLIHFFRYAVSGAEPD